MKKSWLKNTALATVLATTLTACGGGGGGPAGPINDFVNNDLTNLNGSQTLITQYSDLLTSFQSVVSNGNYSNLSSLIDGPNNDDISKAGLLLEMLTTAEALWSDTEQLINNQSDNNKFTIYNSDSFKNAYASILYLKNYVKPIVQKVANGEKISLDDYKIVDSSTRAEQIINNEKDSTASDYANNKKIKSVTTQNEDTAAETFFDGTAVVSYGDWETVHQGGGDEQRTVTTTTPKFKRTITTRCTFTRTTYLNGTTSDGASSCSQLSNTIDELDSDVSTITETREGSNPVVSEKALEATVTTTTEESAEYTETTHTDATDTTSETTEGSATTATTNRDVTTSTNNGTNTFTYTTTRYVDTTVTTPVTTKIYRTRHYTDKVMIDSRSVTTTTPKTEITYKDGTTEIVDGTPTIVYGSWTTSQKSSSSRSENILIDTTTSNTITTTSDAGTVLRTWTSDAEYTDNDVNLGTKTVGYNSNANHYETNEYLYRDSNGNKLGYNEMEQINASSAYSKGWTGKGSIVAIADTGYDIDHSEFSGQIHSTKDYTGTGMQDSGYTLGGTEYYHGTHVLGTVVAKKDNVGMHGVAFDSQAIVVKIGDGRSVDLNNAKNGLAWAADQGAVVGNLSANTNYDYLFRGNLTQLDDGTWQSTDTRYDYKNKLYYNEQNPSDWKNITDKNMVLVNSAGNQGLSVSAHPGYFVTAKDDSGNLILGGKVLIVGAVDHNNNLYAWSNQAGHICQNIVDNACADTHKVSDFYVLAPGNSYSTTDGGYTNMSGTSMAAPYVTGQVAILHQMWPHMKAENLVKLVTSTADKNINGYNVNIHGQGIIDLDEATQPQGAVGIATTGRVDGSTSSLSNTYISGSSSALATLSNVKIMILDGFDRDYYTTLGSSIQVIDTRKISDIDVLNKGYFYLPFNNSFGSFAQGGQFDLGYMNFGLHTGENGNGDYSANVGKEIFLSDKFALKANVGQLNEATTWLGNASDGALAVGENNITNYAQIGASYQIGNNVLSIDYSKGNSDINTVNNSLITGFSDVTSESWRLAYEVHKDENNTLGWSFSLPSHITSGSMNMEVAESVNLDGSINYTTIKSDLSSKHQEKNVGFYYNHTPTHNTDASFNFTAEYRQNISGIANNDGVQVGMNYVKKFFGACKFLWKKNPKCYDEKGNLKPEIVAMMNGTNNIDNNTRHGLVYDMKTDKFVPIEK